MQGSQRHTRRKKVETEKLVKELWQNVAFEDAENKLPEEQKVVSEEIAAQRFPKRKRKYLADLNLQNRCQK